ISGDSRYSSWAVTPNHRMWASKMNRGTNGSRGTSYHESFANWKFLRADEMKGSYWHTRVAPEPNTEEYPVSDAYLNLVGAYVSEGSVGKRLKTGEASVLR